MRKILYSPGFGAGWSSWNSKKLEKFMLEYAPIIDFIESGGEFSQADIRDETIHPLLKQLREDVKEKFNETHVRILGADQLKVKKVAGRVRIGHYDGNESVEEEGEFQGWI